jgi:hypothetical protein
MPLFLTIREGPAPDDSYPILATADQDLIQIFVRGLTRKLGGDSPAVSILKRHRKADDKPDRSNDGK